MQLVVQQTNQVIASHVINADTFWKRFKGLMFKKHLNENHAIHLAPCKSIHTFFMRFPIDILYLNDEHEIVGMETDLAPGRIGTRFSNAKSVVEFSSGALKKFQLTVGQRVDFVQCNRVE